MWHDRRHFLGIDTLKPLEHEQILCSANNAVSSTLFHWAGEIHPPWFALAGTHLHIIRQKKEKICVTQPPATAHSSSTLFSTHQNSVGFWAWDHHVTSGIIRGIVATSGQLKICAIHGLVGWTNKETMSGMRLSNLHASKRSGYIESFCCSFWCISRFYLDLE